MPGLMVTSILLIARSKLLAAAIAAGAEWLVLCDNGGTLPHE